MIKLFTLLILFNLNWKTVNIDKVYLCMGSRSYAYHLYKDCRAFDKCTTKICTVNKTEVVKDKKRTLCKWCGKRQ